MRPTEKLVEELLEMLEVKTMFTIPVFGGLEISETVVVMWIVMAVFVIGSAIMVKTFKVVNPGKVQLLVEWAVEKYYNFFCDLLGEHGKEYIPYLMSTGLFIGAMNMIGLFGFKPPTKDLCCTIGFALVSIILVEFAGIKAKGPKGWLKGFTEPIALITPINIIEVIIKPFSLCLRLFGNVLGAFVIMELIKIVVPVGLPLVCSFYFDLFDGFIQAYVFVFLTGLYIKEAVE